MAANSRVSKKLGRKIKKSGVLSGLRTFSYVLIVVSIVLYFFWGEFGFFRMWVLDRRIDKLERDILNLKVTKQDLLWEIDKMKNDPDYIVRYAVENYGYARSDQRLIQFIPSDSSAVPVKSGSKD